MKHLLIGLIALVTILPSSWAYNPPEIKVESVSLVIEPTMDLMAEHQVLAKQTLYSIAKVYGLTVNDLYRANPELRDRLVKVNEKILIPLNGMSLVPTIEEGPKAYYNVKPKETLFRLARVYFNMEVDHLRRLNNMEGNDLEIGQRLLIGTLKAREVELDSAVTTSVEEDIFDGMEWVEEKNVAYWLRNEDMSTSMVILHNEAPINSLVEITNPMYNRTVMAKVIGRIPDQAYTRDIDAVISHGVATELGAIDPRFYVKIRYLSR
jgi:LysM repeat protein